MLKEILLKHTKKAVQNYSDYQKKKKKSALGELNELNGGLK